jgi:hypothetical protein
MKRQLIAYPVVVSISVIATRERTSAHGGSHSDPVHGQQSTHNPISHRSIRVLP